MNIGSALGMRLSTYMWNQTKVLGRYQTSKGFNGFILSLAIVNTAKYMERGSKYPQMCKIAAE